MTRFGGWDKYVDFSAAQILAETLNNEGAICPPLPLVFKAFEETPVNTLRAVIIGQDPYHTPGKARGVAFGYHPGYKDPINSSLWNVLVEADAQAIPRTLKTWTKQGVLLLNTRLTCEEHTPLSHAKRGWEPFVDSVIDAICHKIDRTGIVFMLWGREARTYARRIPAWNCVLTASHPCRYSAERGKEPFMGCRHFRKANEYFAAHNQPPINWTAVR